MTAAARSRGLAVGLLFTCVASVCSAQDRPAAKTDPAAAEVLFAEARALQDRGKQKEACAKFDESYRLDPAPGTLLNIAACSRAAGKTATAWGQFVEAAQIFGQRGDTRRAAFAKAKAAELERLLARVIIIADAPASGLVVERDGVELGSASLGTPLPVDPGPHEIVARAKGHRQKRQTFEAVARRTVEVKIPPLEALPPEPIADPATVAEAPPVDGVSAPDDGAAQRAAGWIVGGVGLASLTVGVIFVGLTAERKDAADPDCPNLRCNPAGAEAIDTAETYANVANGTLIAGGVLVGVGLVVLLTAPNGDDPDPVVSELGGVHVMPVVGPDGAYVSVQSQF